MIKKGDVRHYDGIEYVVLRVSSGTSFGMPNDVAVVRRSNGIVSYTVDLSKDRERFIGSVKRLSRGAR